MMHATKIVAIIFAVVTTLLSAELAEAGLLGHWKLDEASGNTAADSSGNGNDGTLNGEPVWQPAGGKVDGALEFDGLNDYVSTGFVLNPASGPFSAFAWVKGGGPKQAIISQTDEAGFGTTWLCVDPNGKLTTSLTDGGRMTPLLAPETIITDGVWHRVGIVWDGSRRYLYADGTEVAKDTDTLGRLYASDGGLYFGSGKALAEANFWCGSLDDIRIYDHALSVSEIEHLAKGGAGVSSDSVGVVALAPKTLYTQIPATVSITAVKNAGRIPAVIPVSIRFKIDASTSSQVFEGATDSSGRVTARFDVPDVTPGSYALQIEAEGLESPLVANVLVRELPVLLIETDKPIYKPGQTIQGRVLVLTNQLRPAAASEVDVEITDGKGVKIFRKSLTTNAFGVAPFELDLANELNFGTWKISVESGSASGAVDVRVEKYVLPRFDIELVTERDYFLVDETIGGTIKATYFFGKPVDGTIEVRASRYVGVWEEYATYTATLSDGSAEFTLPEVGYVSGTPGAGGSGSVQLEAVVTDTSGHEEKTTKLLKIVESTIQHQLVALSRVITPGQPFEVLLVAETPDGEPVNVSADVSCEYFDSYYSGLSKETKSVPQVNGKATVLFTAPENTAWAWLESSVRNDDASADADLIVYAAYSPSDNFLHLSLASDEPIGVGDIVTIDVFRTHDATIYYDVFANGHTVWSDATTAPQITFQATQQMVPAAKIVAYIINPNNEISADTLPLEVSMDSTAQLTVGFDAEQALPGDPVQVSVQADTEAMVGIAIVDESVYALNEGRLNMQEVFNELERRFMEPQSETHEFESPCGAYDVFNQAGLQLLVSDQIDVPEGRNTWWDWLDGPVVAPGPWRNGAGGPEPEDKAEDTSLAEVTRIRQFFPETWLWLPELLTEPDGTATVDLTAPDSITTWRLHATSTSDSGLGMAESKLLVFQEFFGEPDLPYAVTRGEQFPVRIQIFNYLDAPQTVHVELADAEWFDLLEPGTQQVLVNANSVGLASFLIQPTQLGRNTLEVTLRSVLRADAVRKELLVEAEGTQRELVTNGIIRADESLTLDANVPCYCVPGSEKLLLSVTPSLVAQSINGVDDLLHMPYGCGEQNMIFFAPDVEILRYLDATGQLTPEVRAKAEHFITVGYQRQLTFRHQDGSFSAFGENGDRPGSLWLTAFVLDCFSGARDVQTIDETVLAEAAAWIEAHQLADGSWEPVGFICHTEMIGGMEGNYALTAFVTIALADYGTATPDVLTRATEYLTNNLSSVQDDPYALAVVALAFARLDDPAVELAIARLLEIAITDGEGIHWKPHAIETTAYAALAMIETEKPQANEAIKWLSLQRNSLGGFSSTQETVMALKALMTAARAQTRNVDLTITAKSPDKGVVAQFTVNSSNFDVLQIAELPVGTQIELSATGSGEARFQLVRRFNVMLADNCIKNDMALEVTYDAEHVDVDDIVNVTAVVRYFGRPGTSGMMIVDVGVPTGFSPVQDSLDALVEAGTVSKVEVAGRKVIFYVDELTSGEQRTFTFQVKARFPVRAVIPDSKAYLYYEPNVRAEAAGRDITVGFVACSVDLDYLAGFSDEWLQAGPDSDCDLDHDGFVDFKDFSLLADSWCDACPQ
jgi:CD109 antigen